MKNTLISLKHVYKRFVVKSQPIEVLKDINLTIEEGDFVIIFGPSGCGKSTLLHTMLGLELPTTGEVTLFENLVTDNNEDKLAFVRKNNIGIIAQQSNWIKSLNVLGNTALPAVLKGESEKSANLKAKVTLDTVGMSPWREYRPVEISSGQQQKVGLARAISTNPVLIVADEPTGNMDYESGINLVKILQRLNKEGTTIVMVTHDFALLAYAKRIVSMLDGKIIKEIPAGEGVNLVNLLGTYNKDSEQTSIELIPPKEKNFKQSFFEKSKKILKEVPYIAKILFIDFFKSIGFPIYLLYVGLSKFPFIKNSLVQIREKYFNKNKREFESDISREYLLKLSVTTILLNKARSIITIGGMAISIAVVVFLISIAYGLENFVVSRVANFRETRQFDATPASSANLKIDDNSVQNFKTLNNVNDVYPLSSIVGKLNYEGSSLDLAVYATTTGYMKNSSLTTIAGELFKDENQIEVKATSQESISDQSSEKINRVEVVADQPQSVVVNESLIKALGINIDNAVGKEFKLSYIITSNLTADDIRIETNDINYKIAGVIQGKDNPLIYVSINGVEKIGLKYYSELRFDLSDTKFVNSTRQSVEVQGFSTTSVLDTISEIGGVFSTLRTALGGIGFVALIVASLGIFNTLSVSLLERTREIGILKVIGMKSSEIHDFLLIESLLISLSGGILGLVIGALIGKVFSIVVNYFWVPTGTVGIDISLLPIQFIIFILVLSLVTGGITGVYPAYRAMRLSALNALRYE